MKMEINEKRNETVGAVEQFHGSGKGTDVAAWHSGNR